MRLSKHRRSTSVSMNMTPMIDVVFNLIIFFMTVSQVTEINREQLELPQQAGVTDQKPAVLIINVTKDDEIVVGGAVYQLSELVTLAADELARLGDSPSQLTIVLRADRRGASTMVNRVVTALSRLDIRKLRISVQVPR